MTLIPYILIAIPTCLLAIAVWTYFDYRKYKKKNSLILLLFLFYPMLLHAQYTDRNHCSMHLHHTRINREHWNRSKTI